MQDLNIIFNLIYKFILFVAVMTVLTNPEIVGEWEARKDVAYDSIWSEWIMDCDCTEALE